MTYTRWPLVALWQAIDKALAKDDAEAFWNLRESINPKARGRLMSMSAMVVRAVTTTPLPTACLDMLKECELPWPKDWIMMAARQSTRDGVADWQGVLDWCKRKQVATADPDRDLATQLLDAMGGEPHRIRLPFDDPENRRGRPAWTQAAHLLRLLVQEDPTIKRKAQDSGDPWNWFELALAFPEDTWVDTSPRGTEYFLWYGLRSPNCREIDNWVKGQPGREEALGDIIAKDRELMEACRQWRNHWIPGGKLHGSRLEAWNRDPDRYGESPLDHRALTRKGMGPGDHAQGQDLLRDYMAYESFWDTDTMIRILNRVVQATFRSFPWERQEVLDCAATPEGRAARHDLQWFAQATEQTQVLDWLNDGRGDSNMRWVKIDTLLEKSNTMPALIDWRSQDGRNLLEHWLVINRNDTVNQPTRKQALKVCKERPEWVGNDGCREALLRSLKPEDAAFVRRRLLGQKRAQPGAKRVRPAF